MDLGYSVLGLHGKVRTYLKQIFGTGWIRVTCSDWVNLFPGASFKHISHLSSDYCLILISIDLACNLGKKKGFDSKPGRS